MPREILPPISVTVVTNLTFFENTIREVKATSFKKRIYLSDSEPEEHTSVFYRGEMVEILCPRKKGTA
jgi:hypothetical protein